MTDTANHLVPEQGKFRRALAAVVARLRDAGLHQLRLHSRSHRTLGTGGGTTKGGSAPKPLGPIGPLPCPFEAFTATSCDGRNTSICGVPFLATNSSFW